MRIAWLVCFVSLVTACGSSNGGGAGSNNSDALSPSMVEGARRGGGGGAIGGGTSGDAATSGDGRPEPMSDGGSTPDGAGPSEGTRDAAPKLDVRLDGAPAADTAPGPDAPTTPDAAALPDAAPNICQTTCSDLQKKYEEALGRAKICFTVNGCGVQVLNALACGCKTWVTNSRELDPLIKQWDDAGCGRCAPLCLRCPVAPASANCTFRQGGPGPVTTTTSIVIDPRSGTCTDQKIVALP